MHGDSAKASRSGKLALVGGHAIAGVEATLAGDAEPVSVETRFGPVEVLDAGAIRVLQRHGRSSYRTAMAIEHRANISALAELGVDRILAVCSVGGLRPELGISSWLCPDDFIALHLGISFGDGHEGEVVPRPDSRWRGELVAEWQRRCEPKLTDGGVYWQALGPRFETAAEIRLIAAQADVIGMTMASECILAGEAGIDYAALCVVDNLANGIGEAPLTVAEFERGKAANREALLASLGELLPALTQ